MNREKRKLVHEAVKSMLLAYMLTRASSEFGGY